MDNAIKTFYLSDFGQLFVDPPCYFKCVVVWGGGRLLFSNLWSHFPEPPVEGPSGPALLPKAPKARKYCFTCTVESGNPSPPYPQGKLNCNGNELKTIFLRCGLKGTFLHQLILSPPMCASPTPASIATTLIIPSSPPPVEWSDLPGLVWGFKKVYVSKIQSGIGGHQFRNSSRTVPLEIRVDKVDEPLYQVQKSVYVSKIQSGIGGHQFRTVLGLYLWKSGWIKWMNHCTKLKNRYMSRKSRVE